MINKIKGAIFDMDGTLINSLVVWDVIWRGLREKFSKDGTFQISPENDKKVRTMTLLGAMEFVHKEYNLGNSGEELFSELNRILLDFYTNEVEVKEGVIDFLEYCLENNIKMCIASATDVSLLRVVMERFSFDKYFSDILSCADIGKGKNEPDIFLEALKSLGTDINETCVFEDSQAAIETAHKAGFMTVGIFDKNNYGQDIIKKTADRYIAQGETLLSLLEKEKSNKTHMIKLNFEKMGFTAQDADSITELDLKYSDRIEELVQAYVSGRKEEPFVPYKENDREESYITAQNYIKDVQAKLPELDGNTARLIGWIKCLPFLYESYIKNGLDESLFYESVKDFAYKVKECKDVYDTLGLFTDWFFLFFDFKLFSLGRLQYEITTFMCDEYSVKDTKLKKGDTVYYCHIPSSGKLNEELCMDSFQKAYEFFKPRLDGNIIPIVSYTWLLYKPYTESVFPEGSNLKKFTELFDIIKADSTGDFFEDSWRVFNKEYEGTVEGLPSDNTLRRNFIEYIKKGGDFGEGYGVILYNGETKEIINKK